MAVTVGVGAGLSTVGSVWVWVRPGGWGAVAAARTVPVVAEVVEEEWEVVEEECAVVVEPVEVVEVAEVVVAVEAVWVVLATSGWGAFGCPGRM